MTPKNQKQYLFFINPVPAHNWVVRGISTAINRLYPLLALDLRNKNVPGPVIRLSTITAFTPSQRPPEATAPLLSRATVWSSPHIAPRLGVISPTRSPQAAGSPQYRSATNCTKCKQTGHSSSRCPKAQCYRCGTRELILWAFWDI
ncbi:hypothetical protein BKA65DRAFT_481329 [Rhexocercosporidium sp. MPI-PUGE-AT-0058]|nr:hypothetical protein BKA65DRAFT_481329 [Rhexocercosporidium sp. MPI-PUGE-AT-0058]